MNPNLQVYYSVRSVRFWDGSVFFLQIWGAVAGEDCVGSARFRRRCRCCQRGETWRKFPDCCSNPVAFRGGVACVPGDSKSAFARKPIGRRLFKQFDSRTFSFQKSVELCWILFLYLLLQERSSSNLSWFLTCLEFLQASALAESYDVLGLNLHPPEFLSAGTGMIWGPVPASHVVPGRSRKVREFDVRALETWGNLYPSRKVPKLTVAKGPWCYLKHLKLGYQMFQCLGHPIPSHSNRFEQIRTSCSYLFIISLPYDFDGSKIRKIHENCDASNY